MSRRHWSYVCAVVACLTIGAAPASKPNDETQLSQPKAAEKIAKPVEKAAATTPVDKVDGSEYEKPCASGAENRESDLCAQWKAADAARDAANLTLAQTALGILGFFGLIATVLYTRKATKAAVDAVAIAQETAVRSLRAYLEVFDIHVTGIVPGGVPMAHLTIRNGGQTPARRVRVAIAFVTTSEQESEKVFFGPKLPTFALGADRQTMQECSDTGTPLSAEQITGYLKGEWGFVFAGVIIYRDIYGVTRRLTFKSFSMQDPPNEGSIRMAVGNRGRSN